MPDLVTLTIDGQKTSVPKGTLAIEAATRLGIDVPRFCYHPKLSAVGMCRMCLGEVGMPKMNPDKTPALNEDGTPQIAMMPKPQTLCTTQAAEGMVVLTETDAVKKMQRGMMEFFLANHPLDCPVCDKGGECMLQDQAMGYGMGVSRVGDLYAQKKDLAKDYTLSPLITLDQERCIQCARCTRFCDEIAQDHVLGLFERGSKTLIGTFSDPPFDTKFSGNTADVCPVGALTSRAFRFKSRVWELDNIATVSMADGCGTNIFVGTRNEYLVRVIPRDNESINECWISDKDRFGLEYADNEARLTYPLVRRDGQLAPASWDEALQLIADKLKSTPKEKIAAVGGPKLTNEGALAMARLFREVVSTPNVDSEWRRTLQTPGAPPANLYEELEGADAILVVGSNPNEELPILDLRLKKAAYQKKASLVVVNPAKTSLDDLAKAALRANEGSEAAIVNAISKLVHQSWHDEPSKTEMLRQLNEQSGARAWLDSLAPYASGAVAQSAGVDESTLRIAADAIASSERLFLLIGADAAPEVLTALQNLAALKSRSDAVVVLQPEANAVGVRRAGLVPGESGKSGEEILEAAARGEIEVLFLAATNPLNGARDFQVAGAALEKTPFVVVQTLFQNEVTQHADVVLPAASFLEQDGTTTNFHGRVQNLHQVFRPRERRDDEGNTLSACAPDWMIFTKLALLLGADWPYKTVADWMEQNRELPVALPVETQFVPAGGQVAAASTPAPEGALRLATGPLLYDGGESFDYCSRLGLVVPEPFIKIHRADARKLDIENKALVEIKTSRGTAKVRADVGREVKPGTAWLPRRLKDVRANAMLEPGAETNWVTITQLEAAPQEDPNEPVVVTA
jgi:NADH-quinone oxidoreductase subunit G